MLGRLRFDNLILLLELLKVFAFKLVTEIDDQLVKFVRFGRLNTRWRIIVKPRTPLT
jgi:hypothetical protein